MEVFERSKFKKIYILERDNKIIDYAFTPFTSKRKTLKSMVKKSSICAVPPPSRYKTDCYDYSISKILICDGDKYIEVYSQSEPGFVTLLIYYLLNKNKLWKSNLKIKICKRVYEDYYFDNEDIYTAAEYCADCIGVVDTMEAVQYLLLTITIIVVILVTILLERTFISDEKGQIALLKAMGFTDGAIIRWHVYRFGIVAIIVEILSVILAKPITKLWCDPIFGMLGASEIDYYINPMKTFIMYPGIIFLVTIGTAWITSLYTKKIKCADTANIE